MYYSNDILSKSLPELASYVSLAITIVNFFTTFPLIFLIEARSSRIRVFATTDYRCLATGQETTNTFISYWRSSVSSARWLRVGKRPHDSV